MPQRSSNCVAGAVENYPWTFTCSLPAGFSGVAFADYGTPTGDCSTEFERSACTTSNATAIVSNLCLGKQSCTIDVGDKLFGDPCFNTVKHFSALLNCTGPQPKSQWSLQVAVPTNAKATVRIPYPSSLPATAIAISENATVVWTAGHFIPGIPGITGARVGNDSLPVGQGTIDVEVGSGMYSFLAVY